MPSTPAIDFVTSDFARWGAGTGAPLQAADVDGNFYNLQQAIAALQSNPAQPNNIVGVTTTGTSLYFLLADGTQLGPVGLPVLSWRWRGAWATNTSYSALDVVSLDGLGIFLVLQNLTSGTVFDPSATDASGNPLYQQLWGSSLPFYLSYSLPGAFADIAVDESDGNYELFDVLMPVAVTLPAGLTTSPTPGCETAPAADVTLTLQQIHAGAATAIGTMTIAAGQTAGSYAFASAVTVPAGDRLRLYAASGVDSTIAGLFGCIAGTR